VIRDFPAWERIWAVHQRQFRERPFTQAWLCRWFNFISFWKKISIDDIDSTLAAGSLHSNRATHIWFKNQANFKQNEIVWICPSYSNAGLKGWITLRFQIPAKTPGNFGTFLRDFQRILKNVFRHDFRILKSFGGFWI
jgi:hypothetical protein